VELATWVVLVLAVVQGVSEFLPISSSGHVVILADLLAEDSGQLEIADLNVVLHVGTLFSIILYYWNRIWRLLGEDRRTIGLLVVATLPAVVVGFSVKRYATSAILENPLLAGCLLPVTGLILLWGARYRGSQGEYRELTYRRALWIGLSQAGAILPGLSRSGLTISMGLRVGLAPSAAATFSFLLAIPVIAGAGLLEAVSMIRKEEMTTPWPILLAGMVVSFVVGVASLWALDHLLQRGRVQWFAIWVIPVGILFVAAKLAGWL
jgi:undecaprenyl-diphosphatase